MSSLKIRWTQSWNRNERKSQVVGDTKEKMENHNKILTSKKIFWAKTSRKSLII